jgi:hypothetical protein
MRIYGIGIEHALGVGYVGLLVASFGGFVVESVGDTLFVCFIVDVDGDRVGMGGAHLVFADLLK